MRKIGFLLLCLFVTINGSNKEIIYDVELTTSEKTHLDEHFNSMKKYEPQESQNRIFNNTKLQYTSFNLDSLGISKGYYFQCDNGFLYINDYSSGLIHKILLDNSGFRSTLGRGIGEAPGQFINVTGMTFDENYLYVADGPKSTIEIFNKKVGTFVKSIKIKNANPHKIHMLNNNILIQNIEDRIYPFQVYDTHGNYITKYGGPLVNKNLFSGHYHESHILIDTENGFFYFSRILGLIGKYENEKLVQVYETIDGVQDPDLKQGRPRLFTAAHSGLTKNHIICQVKNYDNKHVNILYDVYGHQNMKYIYSFKLDADLITYVVYENLLIGCDKNNDMYIFKLKSL